MAKESKAKEAKKEDAKKSEELAAPTSGGTGDGAFVQPGRKFLVKPYLEAPSLAFQFQSRKDNGRMVSWAPNYRTQTGISLSYAGLIGISFTSKSELKAEDQTLKGNSDYSDLQLRLPWRRISLEVGIQRNKGFYAENTNSFDTITPGYVLHPELVLESRYINLIGVISPDQYSLAAAFDQSERQVKSGGSILVSGHLAQTLFHDQQPVIPSQLQPYFANEGNVTRGQLMTVSMGAGYGYMYNFWGSGYVFAQGLLAFGLQSGTTSDDTYEFYTDQTSYHGKIDLGVGGNGETTVGGLLFSFDQVAYKTSNTEMIRRNGMIHIFFGYRF